MDYRKYAKELVNQREDIIAAYGYGSAFSHQSGYTENTKKSLDMIFVVEDIKKWNNKNFKLNKKDYTKYTKAIFKVVPKIILTNSTSVIYNVITKRYDEDFKYGLIEKERLIDDLTTWKHFYVCGRMQKPTYVIKGNKQIDEAIEYNRKSALLTALLILDADVIKLDDLLETICNLSYKGDVRTIFAENPNKVKNIVKGSKDLLINMYLNNSNINDEYILYNRGEFLFVDMDKVDEDKKYLPISILQKCEICGINLDEYIKRKNLKESIAHPAKQFLVSGLSTCKDYMSEKIKKKNLK